ncbi:hypothetical protein M8C21_014170 [Ambrosia artemisiifolia]|uniref:Secreted protein n=1 Tax=Ambrosia artemisiifolia TaxID=4212 RepID=A0AAD5DEQ3_AMBAR|nr:hypothetical protein M8C21_014170 [Ambrosia artemisiifolia]
MASFCVKSLCILVLIAAVFCYPGASIGLPGPIGKGLGRIFKPTPTVPKPRRSRGHNPTPPPPRTIHPSAQEFGENLAQKYFGDKLIKGFRWGYKQGNRMHSVPRKCDDFISVLATSSCPRPLQTSPLSSSANNVHCIVEVTNYSGTKGTCIQTYESSQYPPEATCILDQPNTLGSKCTA